MSDPSDFERRYAIIRSRDRRFDGQFVTGVLSTGVYCRPSCPARTPAPGRVRFYPTSAAAQAAGFRACKRCQPEAAPGAPGWDRRGETAQAALRLITDGLLDREGLAGLASRLGFSERQTRRILREELGAGAAALARANRAHTAHALLTQTALPMWQVADAAGFGSVRQYNDTIRAVFAVAPTRIRRATRPDARGHQPPNGSFTVTLHLPAREPFDVRALFRFLIERAVPGVEDGDAEASSPWHARTLRLPGGPGALRATWADGRLAVCFELSATTDLVPAIARARRLYDLDADPIAVASALGEDARLAPLVAAAPGLRVPGCVDPAEMCVRAIVGQQISVQAARRHLSRLTDRLGEPVPTGLGLIRLFPTAERIAGLLADPAELDPGNPARTLRLPGRTLAALAGVVRAIADDALPLGPEQSPGELAERLTAFSGVGAWTAGYTCLRALPSPDAWPRGDVALLAGARAAGVVEASPDRRAGFAALEAAAERWSPWRSYAATHLWRAAEGLAARRSEPTGESR